MPKKPKLELLLIDEEGNADTEIIVRPVFSKKKVMPLLDELRKGDWQGIVPIGIEISNAGDIPVCDIKMFLEFPKECELFSKADAEFPFKGDFEVEIPSRKKPTEGGLYVSPENKSEARAWVEVLSNGHKTRHFDEVYVKFPEAEQKYKIKAKVTHRPFDEVYLTFDRSLKTEQKTEIKTEAIQNERLSENFEFLVTVMPEVR
jgi:hypothetical protein